MQLFVAPRAGAWLETHDLGCFVLCAALSRPVRARGLKPFNMNENTNL